MYCFGNFEENMDLSHNYLAVNQRYTYRVLQTIFNNFQLLLRSPTLLELDTDPYFLQNFQSNKTVCLIIQAFRQVYKHEIDLF